MEHRRSILGPLLLIAAGLLWLLSTAGVIPTANFWALVHIWPFVLILAGAGLILRPYWKYALVLMDVLIVGGLVLAILFAPQLGWANPSFSNLALDFQPDFGPGVPGSGNVVTDDRAVQDFHAVQVDYPAQVFISQGESESVKIEAEDNLLPGLKTENRAGVLVIYYRSQDGKHVNPTKPVKITVMAKDLTDVKFSSAGELDIEGLHTQDLSLFLTGAGNVTLANILVDNLTLRLSGAGSVTASGTANDLDVTISGFGDFKGADLHSKAANVDISGAGGATVWVDDQLTAEISGAGSVNYYGSANVTRHISGLGGVNRLGNK
jgi:hypothetical protein